MDPHGLSGERGPTGERYRFGNTVSGEVVVDAVAHTLTRDGQPRPVEPKAFAVLLMLLRHAGELVTHDQLIDAVWGHRHVTPGVLTRAIGQLRHALEDHPHEPRYIQTQHALGYRFIGELQPWAPLATSAPAPEPERAPTDAGVDAPPVDAGETEPPVEMPATGPPPDSEPALPQTQGGASGALALSSAAQTTDDAVAAGRRPPWHIWGLVALALVTLMGIFVLAPLQDDPTASPATDASIAVLPFTSLSDERDNRYFAEGLALEMHEALANVPGLKVAARGSTAAAQRRNPDVKAIGEALGVATVLDASVRQDGQRVHINARLSDTATGFTLWSDSYDRKASDVFAVQSEIASEVVQALLGVLPTGGRTLGKRLAPTDDIAAYEAYLKGMQQLTADGPDLDRAIELFKRALGSDPGFARAQAGICRAEIVRFEAARDTPAFERAQEACMRASRMDPELREVSLALGEMYRVRGDFIRASEQYLRALDDVALRPAAFIGLARTQSAQGRNALALDYFEQARLLQPGDPTVYTELGYHQYLSGDVEAAVETFRTATGLLPEDPGLWSSLGGLYLIVGQVDRAEAAFERSLAIKPSVGALTNLGTLRYEQRAYAEAADLYRHASELDPDDFRIWGNLGDALSALPATAQAARAPYSRAAQMAASYVEVKSGDAQALALLGWYRANLGQSAVARQQVREAQVLPPEGGEVALINAQTLARLGDVDGARQQLVAARDAGVPASRIQASPLLRSLPASGAVVTQDRGQKARETAEQAQ